MFPAAILFLVIGLVIILATSWVQAQAAGGAPAADQPAPWEEIDEQTDIGYPITDV